MKKLFTPPEHINFKAELLFGKIGEIVDGAIAYIDKEGGGPIDLHTHENNHIFIVTKGEAKILYGDKEIILKENESMIVEGRYPHSVWNNKCDEQTIIVGITVKGNDRS